MACPSLALSRDARFLLTATDRVIRVWDYPAKASPGCQVGAEGRCVAGGGRAGGGRYPQLTLCLLGPDTPEDLLLRPWSGGSGGHGQACRMRPLREAWSTTSVPALGGPWCPGHALRASGRAFCCPQVYIGHSEPVRAVAFAPGQRQLLSVADAIFLWDVLGAPGRSPSGRRVPALDPCPPGLRLPAPPPDSLVAPQCRRLTWGTPDLRGW